MSCGAADKGTDSGNVTAADNSALNSGPNARVTGTLATVFRVNATRAAAGQRCRY